MKRLILIPNLDEYIMDRYDEDTDTDRDEGVEITDGIVGEDIEEQKKVLQCDGTIVFQNGQWWERVNVRKYTN